MVDEHDRALPTEHLSDSPPPTDIHSSQLNRTSLAHAGLVSEEILQTTTDETLKATLDHETLKYHLLGPSLTKAGQDTVDQQKVSEIIYNASKGSKFFNNEEVKDKNLTQKINGILARKRQLEGLDLGSDRRRADEVVEGLENERDLSQFVVHIDCDAFYAAVEELGRPELRDVPMAVGMGVLTTCNYHARTYGCRSGMAGFVAQKLCPNLISLPLDFSKYIAKAQEVRQILSRYDPRFESASIDEAYMNITSYCTEHSQSPDEVVSQMRTEVRESCGITISAGIAANARLAKICSNRNKPDGQFRLVNERKAVLAYMAELPTRKINGVGRVFERELDAIGIRKCGDIYAHRGTLAKLFGEKAFRFLMAVYLGLGRTRIQPAEEYERKSVGTESTFRDMGTLAELKEKLKWLAEELEGDLKRTQFKGRTLVLKCKLHTYEVLTRQMVPPAAVGKKEDLYKYGERILDGVWRELNGKMTLRLMGLRCTHLVSTQKADVEGFFGKTAAKPSGPRNADITSARGAFQRVGGPGNRDRSPSGHAEAAPAGCDVSPAPDDESYGPPSHQQEPTRPAEPPMRNPDEDVWLCPICNRPQSVSSGNETFNAHIDFCLSKQTIAEAVKEASTVEGSSSPAPPTLNAELRTREKVETSGIRRGKRGRPPREAADGRNKRLFFA